MLRATTACTCSTSQLPKAVRTWCVLYIWTCKCASRHNGVQFFISHPASWLRTHRFSEPTFRPSGASNHLFLSVCPSIYLSVFLSVYQSTYLSINQSINLSTYLSTYLSVHLSIYLSIYPSVYLPVSIYLPVHLSTCLRLPFSQKHLRCVGSRLIYFAAGGEPEAST